MTAGATGQAAARALEREQRPRYPQLLDSALSLP
jgi:hypothetical protein